MHFFRTNERNVHQNVAHSRNNFNSFGDKRSIDANLQRKFNVIQKTEYRERANSKVANVYQAPLKQSRCSKKMLEPNIESKSGMHTFYQPNDKIKELYSKIQNMKSHLYGKKSIASRQGSKLVNLTTTEHVKDSQL